MTSLRACLVALVLAIASLASARLRPPPTVEIDGCVMPAESCTAVRDVIKIRVGDQKLEFGVERLWFPTSTASGSKVLTELKLRGVTAHGPAELTERIVTGAHLRLRGVLRSGPMLLLQSAEPLAKQ